MDVKHYIIRLYIQHIQEDEGHVGLKRMGVILQQEHWMTDFDNHTQTSNLQLFHLQAPTTTT